MKDLQPQMSVLFPKIFRFITEHATFLVITIASLVVLGGIGVEGTKLYAHYQQKEALEQKKLALTKELAYWQDVSRQFSNYRDVYFRIASLEYQLGNISGAKKSLEKVVALDPNFENAQVLGSKINSRQ